MSTIVSFGGQTDGTGAEDALFLKKFAGEILTAFRENNVFISRHKVRNIKSGKSAQFPATWKANSSYHTPGTRLEGQQINMNERIITIDDLLTSDVFIYNLDEAKSHFEYRSEYSYQLGSALARQFDQNVAQVGVLAARASATVSGGNGGSQVLSLDETSSTELVAAAFTAAQTLDEKDVPSGDRFLFLRPAEYYTIANSDRVIDSDLVEKNNGGLDTGRVLMIAGFKLVMTNNLPSTNIAVGPSAYQGDFSDTIGLAMHRSAMGTVKLLDLGVDMDYEARYQGWFTVAKYAIGHGILRPESAIEIQKA